MTYQQKIKARIEKAGNAICVGLDPVLKKIPGNAAPEERIKRFYSDMLNTMLAKNILPAAIKPNSAYYEAVSIPCLLVLQELIAAFRAAGVLAILDAKRGDISTTSGAYAEMAFKVFSADAVTVAPYMGLDTVKPFQDQANAINKNTKNSCGIYVLVRTSNPSAKDFQELKWGSDAIPLYQKVAEKLSDWNDGSLGAVVGATAPNELRDLLIYWKSRGAEIPVLIPGIAVAGVSGGQSGNVKDVYAAMQEAGSDTHLHLINSSSGINYAYEKFTTVTPAEASVLAFQELIDETIPFF